MSWKANSSMEKFQKSRDDGLVCTDFLEYLFPRLFPSCHGVLAKYHNFWRAGGLKIAYPNVEALFHQNKWQRLLGVSETNPHFAVHQKPMM